MQPASAQSRSRQTRASSRRVSAARRFSSSRCRCWFIVRAFLVVGPGVAEAAGQLAGQFAGRPVDQVRGDATRQGRDVRRELLGVALDAADAALVVRDDR